MFNCLLSCVLIPDGFCVIGKFGVVLDRERWWRLVIVCLIVCVVFVLFSGGFFYLN